jgi:hypothetical protein
MLPSPGRSHPIREACFLKIRILSGMKIYVTGFKERPEYKEAMKSGKPISAEDSHDIFYNVGSRGRKARRVN